MSNWTSNCDGCPNAGKYRAIGGDGPQPSPYLLIMERPGQEENKWGRVACGKTGEELDGLYLPLAGLDRREVRICNTVLCGADANKTPTPKEMKCCEEGVKREIEQTKPDMIFLLGATACSMVPTIKLELHHGIPQWGKLFGWEGTVIPMYHPSIGLHESRWMKICIDDWSSVMTTDTDLEEKQDAVDYAIASGQEIRTYCRKRFKLAVDTESHKGSPWSVQYSRSAKMGRLVRVNDREALSQLRGYLEGAEEVVFHNAAYDLEVLRCLGIHVSRYRDTMQEAFHLGNLPQGLKPLVYRFFRHTMTSYQETVWPASINALRDWMTEALMVAQLDFCTVVQKSRSVQVKKGTLESLLIRLLRLAEPHGEYNPWHDKDSPRLDQYWRENEKEAAHVEARLGPYPILGIANCSIPDAIRYACGDADYTGRVAVELDRRRRDSFTTYEGDRDP